MQTLQTGKRVQTLEALSSRDTQARNDDTTTKTVESIKIRLYELIVNGNEVNSDLMLRALN